MGEAMAVDGELDRELSLLASLRDELMAALGRVDEILALRSDNEPPEVERIGNFILDRPGWRILVDGQPVPVSSKEFQTLSLLLANAGRVVSAERLMQEVWGAPPTDRTHRRSVSVHVTWLREKLSGRVPFEIATVRFDPRSSGYRLDLLKGDAGGDGSNGNNVRGYRTLTAPRRSSRSGTR